MNRRLPELPLRQKGEKTGAYYDRLLLALSQCLGVRAHVTIAVELEPGIRAVHTLHRGLVDEHGFFFEKRNRTNGRLAFQYGEDRMFPSTKSKVFNWLGWVYSFWLKWGGKDRIDSWRDLIRNGEVVMLEPRHEQKKNGSHVYTFTRVPFLLPPPPSPGTQTTQSPRPVSGGPPGPAGSSS